MLINLGLRCLTFLHIYQKLPRMGAEQVPLHDSVLCWPLSPHLGATLQQLQPVSHELELLPCPPQDLSIRSGSSLLSAGAVVLCGRR